MFNLLEFNFGLEAITHLIDERVEFIEINFDFMFFRFYVLYM